MSSNGLPSTAIRSARAPGATTPNSPSRFNRRAFCEVAERNTSNAGITWAPIFEQYGAASIGDVAIFEGDPDIIWVGTGEECGRNSATWGDGVYKSTDGGMTFANMGLEDTLTIGTVLTHPTDPDIVYVAALGNIWGPSERGFFKSTDGGETWGKLTNGLPDHDRTGAVEAVMHPDDPDTIWVAFWHRERTSYRLDSGGPEGGVFKTTDGGRTFTQLTEGLPEGASGKIGMAVSRNNPDVMMMHYEHGFQPSQNLEDGSPNPDCCDRFGTPWNRYVPHQGELTGSGKRPPD